MTRNTQFIAGAAAIAAILAAVAWQGFQSTVFYYTPAELLADPSRFQGRVVRVGALVQPGTTQFDAQNVRLNFQVTEDSRHFIPVQFDGVKPDLYREGQGVVVEGRLGGDGLFRATQVLVKHSEEYSVGDSTRADKERVYRSLIQAKQ